MRWVDRILAARGRRPPGTEEVLERAITAFLHPKGIGLEPYVGIMNTARHLAPVVESIFGEPPVEGSSPEEILDSMRHHPEYWSKVLSFVREYLQRAGRSVTEDPEVQYMEYGDPYQAMEVAQAAVEAMKRVGRVGEGNAFLVGYLDGRPVFVTAQHVVRKPTMTVEIAGRRIPVVHVGKGYLMAVDKVDLGEPLPVGKGTSPYIIPSAYIGEADVLSEVEPHFSWLGAPVEETNVLPGSSGSPMLAYNPETGRWEVVGLTEGINTGEGYAVVKRFLREPPRKYDPSKLRNEVLRDDFRILLAWNGRIGKYSEEEILLYMRKLLREIARRVRDGRMSFRIHMDSLKPRSRTLVRKALKGLPSSVRETLVKEVK